MENQLSKHDFLKKETWVNLTQRTVITADITYEGAIGEVHHGFNKKILTTEQLGEAVSSEFRDPGDYILSEFPAAGTSFSKRLDFISIEEAYLWIRESLDRGDKVVVWSSENHDFGYQVSVCQYADFTVGYEAKTFNEALIFASINDWEANTIEASSPKAKGLENSSDWVYLDRSKYDLPNVYLDTSHIMIKRI